MFPLSNLVLGGRYACKIGIKAIRMGTNKNEHRLIRRCSFKEFCGSIIGMLQDYILTYLKKAKYERIDGGKKFFAEIKALRGVWAIGKSIEECRKNLASALEGWIIFRLRRNLPIPNFKIPSYLFFPKRYV